MTGFYIDVGAYDPVDDSVTKHFYDLGWRGINVEPAGHLRARSPTARPRDVNLNVGLSDEPGTLTFYEFRAPESALVDVLGRAGRLAPRQRRLDSPSARCR